MRPVRSSPPPRGREEKVRCRHNATGALLSAPKGRRGWVRWGAAERAVSHIAPAIDTPPLPPSPPQWGREEKIRCRHNATGALLSAPVGQRGEDKNGASALLSAPRGRRGWVRWGAAERAVPHIEHAINTPPLPPSPPQRGREEKIRCRHNATGALLSAPAGRSGALGHLWQAAWQWCVLRHAREARQLRMRRIV